MVAQGHGGHSKTGAHSQRNWRGFVRVGREMSGGEISLPLAIALTGGGILVSIGVAWGVMRQQIAAIDRANTHAFLAVEKKQDQIDRDMREGFNRIARLERDAVTQEAFTEFRREMLGGFKDLRELIENLRAPARQRTAARGEE